MDRKPIRTGISLLTVGVLLFGLAGCGGDDDGGGAAAGLGGGGGGGGQSGQGDAGSGDAGAFGGDPCSVLDASEVEEQFGDRGTVDEGVPAGFVCTWNVGDPAATGGSLSLAVVDRSENPAGFGAALPGDPIDGLGDEAYLDASSPDAPLPNASLYVRSGDVLLSMSVFMYPDLDRLADRLVTLGQRAVDRLES